MRYLIAPESAAAPLSSGWHVKGTGLGYFLVTAGAILLFAYQEPSRAGLILDVAGGIMMLIGVCWLLVPAQRARPKPGPVVPADLPDSRATLPDRRATNAY